MSIDRWLAIIAFLSTIPVYKGWFFSVLRWNKSRKLKSLRSQLDLFVKLNTDNVYLMIWISQGVLTTVSFIAAALMFNGVAITSKGQGVAFGFIGLMATIAYVFAIYRLGQLNKLKKYDQTVEYLRAEIQKLNA